MLLVQFQNSTPTEIFSLNLLSAELKRKLMQRASCMLVSREKHFRRLIAGADVYKGGQRPI